MKSQPQNTHTHNGINLMSLPFKTLQWTPTTEEPVQPDQASHTGRAKTSCISKTQLYSTNSKLIGMSSFKKEKEKRKVFLGKDTPKWKCFADFFLFSCLFYAQLVEIQPMPDKLSALGCLHTVSLKPGWRTVFEWSCDIQARQCVIVSADAGAWSPLFTASKMAETGRNRQLLSISNQSSLKPPHAADLLLPCLPKCTPPPYALCYQIQAGDGAHASPGNKSVWYFSGVCEAPTRGLLRPQIRLQMPFSPSKMPQHALLPSYCRWLIHMHAQ